MGRKSNKFGHVAVAVLAVAMLVFAGFKYEDSHSMAQGKEHGDTAVTEGVKDSAQTRAGSKNRDSYYRKNSKVIKLINAGKSTTIPAERDIAKLLEDRGFSGEPITYEFALGGKYLGEQKVDSKSKYRRPIYKTEYYSACGDYWVIYVINGEVFANPVSYNFVSGKSVQLLISETDTLTSYDYLSNTYYITVPKESAAILKTIDRIDASSLDELTVEGIDGL
ncbi:MAG: hypothetical protein K6G72_04620 [Lachnospiraceae bacterium]|nr:hypothetical protein [Lachnospiraceae bacterium]